MFVNTVISTHLFAYEALSFEHLKEIKNAGFNQIELWVMKPHLDFTSGAFVKELETWIKSLSIEIVSLHAPFYFSLSEARKGEWLSISCADLEKRKKGVEFIKVAINRLEAFRAKTIVIHPSAPSHNGDSDTYEFLKNSLEKILILTEKLGIKIALENIPSELGRTEKLSNFINCLENITLKNCIDTGHALMTEKEKYADSIEKMLPNCINIHLHDNDGIVDSHLPPKEGKIDWERFKNALIKYKYKGQLTYEIKKREHQSYADVLKKLSDLDKKDQKK
ncbi:MAG: sugar phosphate isomerase/epimerase family protein [Nitrospinota bacterium]|nr:sugar phosphate isomerase/epimerase family protein [Nitrospinota bacterium]